MDVCLEDVGEPDPVLGDQVQHAVDVALRVDDKRDLTVMDDIAAVTQGRRLDRDDRELIRPHSSPPSMLRPDRDQATVPPATE